MSRAGRVRVRVRVRVWTSFAVLAWPASTWAAAMRPHHASGLVPWNIVVLLTLLTLLPALVMSLTPFTRLLIVFHFLRQALGTQTAPSNQTLIGLSLVLTYFLMQPVGVSVYQVA